ncbi:CSRN2 protein, partial [Pachycephala philippinensis]|nr:CSRN2 protein [Pachycephala philippinensis]
MKLELENRREEEEEEEEGAAAPPNPSWPPPQPPETQDFQEYLAENERAVLHLQTAEELERLKAEEDSGSGSGGEGGGLCVLGEHLDDTWQVKPTPCPGLGPAILIPSQFPLESPVLCYPPGQGGSQPYLPDSPGLCCPPGARGATAHGEHPAPAASPPGKELGVPPVPAAASKGGAPQNPGEHLEHPHLPV